MVRVRRFHLGGIFGVNNYQELGDEFTGAHGSSSHDDFGEEAGFVLVSRPGVTAVNTNAGIFSDEPQHRDVFTNTGAEHTRIFMPPPRSVRISPLVFLVGITTGTLATILPPLGYSVMLITASYLNPISVLCVLSD